MAHCKSLCREHQRGCANGMMGIDYVLCKECGYLKIDYIPKSKGTCPCCGSKLRFKPRHKNKQIIEVVYH